MPRAKKIFSRATLGTRATGSTTLAYQLLKKDSAPWI
jgi:hypothetical protein